MFFCSSDPVLFVPLRFCDNLLNDYNSDSLQPNEIALNDFTFDTVKHRYVNLTTTNSF